MAAWWELVVSEATSPNPKFVTGLEVKLPLIEVMTDEIGLILWPRRFSLEAPFIRISGVLAGRIDEGEGKGTASGLELPTVISCIKDTTAVDIGGFGDGAGGDLTDEESTGEEGAGEVTQEEEEQEFADEASTVVVFGDIVDAGEGLAESLEVSLM